MCYIPSEVKLNYLLQTGEHKDISIFSSHFKQRGKSLLANEYISLKALQIDEFRGTV